MAKNIDKLVKHALKSDSKKEMAEALELLKKQYERLDKKFNKVIAISDKQEVVLHKTQKELSHYKYSLEEKLNEQVCEIKSLYDEISSTQKEVIFTLGAIGEDALQRDR